MQEKLEKNITFRMIFFSFFMSQKIPISNFSKHTYLRVFLARSKPHLKLDGKLDQPFANINPSPSMHISYLLCWKNFKEIILQKRSNFKWLLENCNSLSHYCFLSMLMLQIMTRGTNTKRPKVVYFRPFDQSYISQVL